MHPLDKDHKPKPQKGQKTPINKFFQPPPVFSTKSGFVFLQFSLEEDDVWRSVFRWSRTRAKVEAPLQDWTDTERENVCKV